MLSMFFDTNTYLSMPQFTAVLELELEDSTTVISSLFFLSCRLSARVFLMQIFSENGVFSYYFPFISYTSHIFSLYKKNCPPLNPPPQLSRQRNRSPALVCHMLCCLCVLCCNVLCHFGDGGGYFFLLLFYFLLAGILYM